MTSIEKKEVGFEMEKSEGKNLFERKWRFVVKSHYSLANPV